MRKKKILIVDDDPDVVGFLDEMLTLWGYECRTAQTALLGVALAQEFVPDVAIIDLHLHGDSGLDVGRVIRSRLKDAGIFLTCTEDVPVSDKKQGFEFGFDGFLPKPYDLGFLQACIRWQAYLPKSCQNG